MICAGRRPRGVRRCRRRCRSRGHARGARGDGCVAPADGDGVPGIPRRRRCGAGGGGSPAPAVATGGTMPGTGDVPGGRGELVGGTPPGLARPPGGTSTAGSAPEPLLPGGDAGAPGVSPAAAQSTAAARQADVLPACRCRSIRRSSFVSSWSRTMCGVISITMSVSLMSISLLVKSACLKPGMLDDPRQALVRFALLSCLIGRRADSTPLRADAGTCAPCAT